MENTKDNAKQFLKEQGFPLEELTNTFRDIGMAEKLYHSIEDAIARVMVDYAHLKMTETMTDVIEKVDKVIGFDPDDNPHLDSERKTFNAMQGGTDGG